MRVSVSVRTRVCVCVCVLLLAHQATAAVSLEDEAKSEWSKIRRPQINRLLGIKASPAARTHPPHCSGQWEPRVTGSIVYV